MKRARLVVAIIITVALIAIGTWLFIKSSSPDISRDISTSGFFEAQDVAVAFENGGRIIEISAKEGDRGHAGVALVKLDASLLRAQRQQADVSVLLAQANLKQAMVSQEGAQKAYQNALDVQQNPLELDAKLIAAQGELSLAKLNLTKEQDIDSTSVVPAAEIRLAAAEKLVEYYRLAEHSVGGFGLQYDRIILTTQAERELALAKLDLEYKRALVGDYLLPAALARYQIAEDTVNNLLAIKKNPQDINAAVDRTNAALQTSIAAVKAAEIQVEQARAALNVIEVQISKLVITAPISGVVSALNYDVSEIAQPGAPVLIITNLDEVTLTAYIPESKIGLVKLGQSAQVSVDSYPAETFSGKVTYISPQAQFTPRNVQLKEEREKTVFAVKISLANPEHKLKPGMPADALITAAP
ncbi:MAG: efflux RND transporter periplasmic adaptor subunit [Dehalococcoidales bacterium]|nr:efflux RND transporter periplasmic adaptor subunit [Dehalococcoidales bacterium]